MSTTPVTPNQGVSEVSLGAAANGADLIIMIELMLLEDYDGQIKDAANQIKSQNKVKKAYREKIAELERIKDKPAYSTGNPEADKEMNAKYGKVISVTSETEVQAIAHKDSFRANSEGEVVEDQLENQGATPINNSGALPYSEESIDRLIDQYRMELDSIDDQDQLFQLKLQQLISARSLALETITNTMKRDDETKRAIVRNLA